MTADYAARVRTLAARHNREWQLLVEDMDRERTNAVTTETAAFEAYIEACKVRLDAIWAEAEEQRHNRELAQLFGSSTPPDTHAATRT